MVTKILISLGIAIGFTIAIITITLIGVLILVLTEKIIDKIKNNIGNEKFNNIKNFSILGLGVIVYILIITFMVYMELFGY